MWRANFGSTTIVNGDGNANGVVDAADYVLWRKNRSAGAAAAASSSVANVTADSSIRGDLCRIYGIGITRRSTASGVGRQRFSDVRSEEPQ